MNKLLEIGKKIFDGLNELSKKHMALSEIDNHDFRSMSLYASFLLSITHDEAAYDTIIERYSFLHLTLSFFPKSGLYRQIE